MPSQHRSGSGGCHIADLLLYYVPLRQVCVLYRLSHLADELIVIKKLKLKFCLYKPTHVQDSYSGEAPDFNQGGVLCFILYHIKLRRQNPLIKI